MIAATSPQPSHRPRQPIVSDHLQGRNFARSGRPQFFEMRLPNATSGHLPAPESHEVTVVLGGAETDSFRVMYPPRPMRNDGIEWNQTTSNGMDRRPTDVHWDRPVNAHHLRRSPPAWTVHQRLPTDREASENAIRRAYNSGARAYFPNVQFQHQQHQLQHWHRIYEARQNSTLDRNSRGSTMWSTSGNVANFVVPSPAEAAKSLVQRNDNKKRPLTSVQMNSTKLPKGANKLDLLCSATLDIGPLHDNPMGCSCPKSKCIALYCDCFKAGRRCNPSTCSCFDCKNTLEETGPHGARSAAIRSILARNPRAFTNAGLGAPKIAPGQIACNCIRSKCLKLYCSCFQNGKLCDTKICTCVDCCNEADNPLRKQAVDLCLEKRPDAFVTRTREPGLGCACKNNRCIRKYCDCFRSDLPCSSRCSCRQCANTEGASMQRGTQKNELEKKDSVETQESCDSVAV